MFNQGDVGSWWYIVFRGSVSVDIAGKGTVCTLKEGEEFGKLALVNNAPRAATIITAEENTQFFKVPKEDFNRILVDVEANTIRLKEHGEDVLILLRLALKGSSSRDTSSRSESSAGYTGFVSKENASSKLVVIAGTAEKMIEYCLESRFDSSWSPAEYQYNNYFYSHGYNNGCETDDSSSKHASSGPTSLYSAHLDLLSKDTFFEDFILTFNIFMTSSALCHHLFRNYKVEDFSGASSSYEDTGSRSDETDFFVRSKRRVIRFVYSWRSISGDHFLSDSNVTAFVEALESSVKEDNCQQLSRFYNKLNAELDMIQMLSREVANFEQDYASKAVKKWKSDLPGVLQIMTINARDSMAENTASRTSSSRQLPSINRDGYACPSSSGTFPSTAAGFAAASSTMFQTAAAVPGLSNPSSSKTSSQHHHQLGVNLNALQTPPALLSSAYTSTTLSSAFVTTSPVASPAGLLPFSVPIPASAALAEYTTDPYFQEPIRPKDESKFQPFNPPEDSHDAPFTTTVTVTFISMQLMISRAEIKGHQLLIIDKEDDCFSGKMTSGVSVSPKGCYERIL